MRILVIGGTRFIGPPVVRRLHEMGHEVTLFHRGETESGELPDVPHIHGDRRHIAEHVGALAQLAPDVALDMLAMSERDARAIMDALRSRARRIVALSSVDVYRAFARINRFEPGPPDPVPLAEDAPLREKLYPYRGRRENLHDYEKILVEHIVMGDPALPGTILRLPMVYGPGDDQHRLFPYLKRMDDGRAAIVLDDGLAGWCGTRGYVENVAAAIALAVADERAVGRVYNVGEAAPVSEAEWVRTIAEAAGWTGEVLVVPRDGLPHTLRWDGDARQDLVADTTRMRAELGYVEVVTRDEALRRTIAWERANPPAHVEPADFDYAAEDAALVAFRA